MTKSLVKALAILGLMAGVAGTAGAEVVTWTGPSDGDNMTFSFTGFSANQLTGITGDGYAHNHGNTNVVFTLDLHVDGAWQTISAYQLDGNDHTLSSLFAGPTSFTGGVVDGIRLTDTPFVGNGYHGMVGAYPTYAATQFQFASVSAVPEPSSLALCVIAGGATLAVAQVRRKQVVG